MKRLWAPWRLDYVRDTHPQGCFLCAAVGGSDDRSSLLVARGRACGVILNRYPYNNGHLLVFPYRHVPDLPSLDAGERSEIMDLLCRCVETLKTAVSAQGFNVGLNLGKCAGAGLEDHVHAHVVPRWSGDTNFMPVCGETRVIPQALLDLWDRLHPLLGGRAP